MLPLQSPPLPIESTAGVVLAVSILITLLWIRAVFR